MRTIAKHKTLLLSFLKSIEQIPNRSKLAIIVAASEQNKQELLKVLSQYETAATQFKKRAAQRYNIVDGEQTPSATTNDKEVVQNWAIDKRQKDGRKDWYKSYTIKVVEVKKQYSFLQ